MIGLDRGQWLVVVDLGVVAAMCGDEPRLGVTPRANSDAGLGLVNNGLQRAGEGGRGRVGNSRGPAHGDEMTVEQGALSGRR